MFDLDKPLQPSLMFASNAVAYRSEVLLRCFTLGVGPHWPHQQILDRAEKAC
jgi:hypothetical protein